MNTHTPASRQYGAPRYTAERFRSLVLRKRGAKLAICSDLDNTPDWETYFEIMKFLNTTEDTPMGPGVGLEVGNSIYFDMPGNEFAYWNTTDKGRAMIRALIKSGHIDCLHSYGDLASTRKDAGRALDELAKHDCYISIWVDHRQAPTNFGSDIMRGHGDDSGHPAYHADLTLGYGVKHIWRGRITSVIGQNQSASLSGLFRFRHPLASGVTIAKELAKQLLARCGRPKYRLHAGNRVLKEVKLRDGQTTFEFLRCNPHPLGFSYGDRGEKIHEVLNPLFLDRLVKRRGICILYTHLGKNGKHRLFHPDTVQAFRLLAEYRISGKIQVFTTARLLDQCLPDPRTNPNIRLNNEQINPPALVFPQI